MKVFSLEKFKADMGDVSTIAVQGALDGGKGWACQSEGKTKEEMNSMGLGTCDEWMIEVPDPAPQSPTSESATSQPLPPPPAPKYGECPVGAVVKIQGIPCRIKSRKRCRGCILTGASMDLCYKYACNPYDRYDAKNVSFVRIKRL